MSESDSFEQESTDGISEQVDALKGFLDEKGLPGGSPSGADSGKEDGEPEAASGGSGDAAFDNAVSAPSPWTSHGGDAPEHEPVAVGGAAASGDADSAAGRSSDGSGWEPVTAPDGEELEADGGSSDGSQSGQDSGSMS